MTPPPRHGATDQPRPTPGPLGAVLRCGGEDNDVLHGARADANARIVLHRTAFTNAKAKIDATPALVWAARTSLGQNGGLVAAIAARRAAAVRDLHGQGYAVRRLLVTPQWRLLAGHGDHANAYETGLALHGTYGWPQLPGSSLKGMVDSYARDTTGGGAGHDDRSAIFGAPRPADRPGAAAGRGSVQFLDALPAGRPVTVVRDVLTRHVQPYYTSLMKNDADPVPPAEHHNPVPVFFLAVSGGAFAVDLVGDEVGVDFVAGWLREACDDIGLGAKTAAGYGYLTAADSDVAGGNPP